MAIKSVTWNWRISYHRYHIWDKTRSRSRSRSRPGARSRNRTRSRTGATTTPQPWAQPFSHILGMAGCIGLLNFGVWLQTHQLYDEWGALSVHTQNGSMDGIHIWYLFRESLAHCFLQCWMLFVYVHSCTHTFFVSGNHCVLTPVPKVVPKVGIFPSRPLVHRHPRCPTGAYYWLCWFADWLGVVTAARSAGDLSSHDYASLADIGWVLLQRPGVPATCRHMTTRLSLTLAGCCYSGQECRRPVVTWLRVSRWHWLGVVTAARSAGDLSSHDYASLADIGWVLLQRPGVPATCRHMTTRLSLTLAGCCYSGQECRRPVVTWLRVSRWHWLGVVTAARSAGDPSSHDYASLADIGWVLLQRPGVPATCRHMTTRLSLTLAGCCYSGQECRRPVVTWLRVSRWHWLGVVTAARSAGDPSSQSRPDGAETAGPWRSPGLAGGTEAGSDGRGQSDVTVITDSGSASPAPPSTGGTANSNGTSGTGHSNQSPNMTSRPITELLREAVRGELRSKNNMLDWSKCKTNTSFTIPVSQLMS